MRVICCNTNFPITNHLLWTPLEFIILLSGFRIIAMSLKIAVPAQYQDWFARGRGQRELLSPYARGSGAQEFKLQGPDICINFIKLPFLVTPGLFPSTATQRPDYKDRRAVAVNLNSPIHLWSRGTSRALCTEVAHTVRIGDLCHLFLQEVVDSQRPLFLPNVRIFWDTTWFSKHTTRFVKLSGGWQYVTYILPEIRTSRPSHTDKVVEC